ncbi:hypothetical protein CC2G_001722 [Coprinopsis cinerea AmutBmut pab1-1]|nr:hypothetical protein CC2G_001722 [Coprinopsis cinerea AmutBmut pab1-1]
MELQEIIRNQPLLEAIGLFDPSQCFNSAEFLSTARLLFSPGEDHLCRFTKLKPYIPGLERPDGLTELPMIFQLCWRIDKGETDTTGTKRGLVGLAPGLFPRQMAEIPYIVSKSLVQLGDLYDLPNSTFRANGIRILIVWWLECPELSEAERFWESVGQCFPNVTEIEMYLKLTWDSSNADATLHDTLRTSLRSISKQSRDQIQTVRLQCWYSQSGRPREVLPRPPPEEVQLAEFSKWKDVFPQLSKWQDVYGGVYGYTVTQAL